MEIPPLISEIKALIAASGHFENRGQGSSLPFTSGQILQATVNAQQGPNLFLLKLSGQEIPVETSTQLQPGQSLSVKITSLSPQLQLQVVSNPPIDQRISTTLPLMVNQGAVYANVLTLAESTPQMSQLSTASQNTLQQMQANLSSLTGAKSPVITLVEQIASTLLSPAASQSTDSSPALATVGQLLQQLAGQTELPAPLRENAQNLASVLLAAKNTPETAQAQGGTSPFLTSAAEGTSSQISNLLTQLQVLVPSLHTILPPIATQLGTLPWLNANQPIEQLLLLLMQVSTETPKSGTGTLDGRQLQTILQNMGLNFEQLLARGQSLEAAGTLKSALLELANLSSTSPSQLQHIDDLLGSIQFSQLMQMRLASEFLLFLPLPFPFLQSGFLLVNNEKNRDAADPKKKRRSPEDKDINMYLQLEGLGNLQIRIQQEADKISLTFYTQDSERAQFIGEQRPELQEMLTTGKLYSAQFLVGAKEPVKILMEKMLHAPTGMVNTVA